MPKFMAKKVSKHIASRNSTDEMVLELHVWGPAFGLASIEPECIATIAYCQRVVPRGQWSLVADHHPTVGATGTSNLNTLCSAFLMFSRELANSVR
jgi:hypothetical protein